MNHSFLKIFESKQEMQAQFVNKYVQKYHEDGEKKKDYDDKKPVAGHKLGSNIDDR